MSLKAAFSFLARGGGSFPRLGQPSPYLRAYDTVGKYFGRLPRSKVKGIRGFKPMAEGGFINSSVPGRTDKHGILVKSGSYVIPAEEVAAIGEGNTNAGFEKIKEMFGHGTRFGPRLKVPKFADGGSVDSVPIIVAGGEAVIPPEIVTRIGGGDVRKGHDILDRWVLDTRKKHISKLKSLKPPKGS